MNKLLSYNNLLENRWSLLMESNTFRRNMEQHQIQLSYPMGIAMRTACMPCDAVNFMTCKIHGLQCMLYCTFIIVRPNKGVILYPFHRMANITKIKWMIKYSFNPDIAVMDETYNNLLKHPHRHQNIVIIFSIVLVVCFAGSGCYLRHRQPDSFLINCCGI